MTWTAFDSMASSLSVIAACAVVALLDDFGFWRWVAPYLNPKDRRWLLWNLRARWLAWKHRT
jgi:hypothetical protein